MACDLFYVVNKTNYLKTGITIHRKTNQLLVAGAVVNGVLAPNITVYNTNANGLTSLAGTFGKNVFAYNGLYGDDRYPSTFSVQSTSNPFLSISLFLPSIFFKITSIFLLQVMN
jgi:hypothetical protein